MVCVLNGDLARGGAAASALSVLVRVSHGYDRPALYGSDGGPFEPLPGVSPARALGGGLYVLTLADGGLETLRVRVYIHGSADHRDSDVVWVKAASAPTHWHTHAPAAAGWPPRFTWPRPHSTDRFIYFVLVTDADLGQMRQAAYTWRPQRAYGDLASAPLAVTAPAVTASADGSPAQDGDGYAVLYLAVDRDGWAPEAGLRRLGPAAVTESAAAEGSAE